MDTFQWIIRSIAILFFMSITLDVALACSPPKGGGFQCTGEYGELQCNVEKWCYDEDQKCNGKKDCPDGTDEDNHHCDHGKWPTFKDIDCSEQSPDQKYTKCFEVNYPGDKGKDYMLLEKVEDAFETYTGVMKIENLQKIAFNLPDTEDGETLAGTRFHSMHVATCSSFAIDLEKPSPHPSICIEDHPTADESNGDDMVNMNLKEFAEYDEAPPGTSLKLNPNGYRVRVKVYYDDAMAKVYSETKVKQKLRSVMVYVEEMFHEVDTLTTKVVIDAKNLKIERAPGRNNWVSRMSSHLGSSLGKLARNSRDEVDLWVFVTARGNGNPLGIAYVGTVCSSGRSNRVSINRYGIAGKQKNKVLYTAETIAHEMGHNLGMRHDFGRKDSRGKSCYGYMDYKDDTNYWSRCSVEDFTKVKKSCLKICSGSNCRTTSNGGTCNDGIKNQGEEGIDCGGPCKDCTGRPCKDNPAYASNCKQFTWACTDSRFPWFKEQCKKTCNAC